MERHEKKRWDVNSIGRVYGIIDDILYSIALYREVGTPERNENVFDPIVRRFWITISDNAIQMAVIHWCKVFGTKNNNITYYSHFVNQDHFKAKLKGISFDNISEQMRYFRDKYAGHEDNASRPIPYFESAIIVMEVFNEIVQEEYDIPYLFNIRSRLEAYKMQIQDCLKECNTDWEQKTS